VRILIKLKGQVPFGRRVGRLPMFIRPGSTSASCGPQRNAAPMKAYLRFSAVVTTGCRGWSGGPTTSNCAYASLTATVTFRDLLSRSCGKPSGEKPNVHGWKQTEPRRTPLQSSDFASYPNRNNFRNLLRAKTGRRSS